MTIAKQVLRIISDLLKKVTYKITILYPIMVENEKEL